MLAGSGVLAIATIVAGTGLAVAITATPARAQTAPVTVDPAAAMPGLPITVTIKCGRDVRSATLYGKTVGLSGPVAMKSTRGGTFAVTVDLPPGLASGVYQAVAGCENGEYGTADLTVNGPTRMPPSRPPSRPPSHSPSPTHRPPPPGAPITGDGTTSTPGGLGGTAIAGLGLLGAGGMAALAALRQYRKRR